MGFEFCSATIPVEFGDALSSILIDWTLLHVCSRFIWFFSLRLSSPDSLLLNASSLIFSDSAMDKTRPSLANAFLNSSHCIEHCSVHCKNKLASMANLTSTILSASVLSLAKNTSNNYMRQNNSMIRVTPMLNDTKDIVADWKSSWRAKNFDST